jgi:hypothetical protein
MIWRRAVPSSPAQAERVSGFAAAVSVTTGSADGDERRLFKH